MRCVFLGAGFSKWAANVPLANSLFDFDIDTGRLSAQDARRLSLVERDWAKWRSSNPNAPVETFIYWSLNGPAQRKSRVIWYVSRRLSEPFMTRISGSFATLMIDDRRAREHKGSSKAREFLLMVGEELTGIITCNYDMLVEFALGTQGFNYGIPEEYLEGRGHNPQFPWQNRPVRVSGEVPLAKLHGSLSWDSGVKYTDGKPGRAGRALLVPPAPEKTPPASLTAMWALAESILRDSEELIVFGFAFNPYDEAMLEFLRTKGGHLKRVLLIDPCPKISVASQLWPGARLDAIKDPDNVMVGLRQWLERDAVVA